MKFQATGPWGLVIASLVAVALLISGTICVLTGELPISFGMHGGHHFEAPWQYVWGGLQMLLGGVVGFAVVHDVLG